jgi:hypothetical protein
MEAILEKVIVAVVAGLFGLMPVILQWIAKRGESRSRHNQITKLTEELNFIEKWVKLSQETSTEQVSSPPHSVQNDLFSILNEYREIRTRKEVNAASQPLSEVGLFRRWFLLFSANSTKGWIVHTIYYFLVIFMFAVVIGDLESPTYDPETGESQFVYLLIGLAVIFSGPLIVLQRMAIRFRRFGEPSAAAVST